MTVDNDNPQLRAAVLLANELLNSHTPEDARILHKKDWESYTVNPPLDLSQFTQDSFRESHLLRTADELLATISDDKNKSIVRLKFGFETGRVETNEAIGEGLEPQVAGSSVAARLRTATKDLRRISSRHLQAFAFAQSNEELGQRLLALGPVVHPTRRNPPSSRTPNKTP